MTNTLRALQEENHLLRQQVGNLKDEVKEKDMMIAALESQVAALILEGRKDGGVVTDQDDSETIPDDMLEVDALSRVSSLGVGSISAYPNTTHSSASKGKPLPPRPPKGSSPTATGISTKSLLQQYTSDDEDDESGAPAKAGLPPTYPPTLRPPSRNNIEMKHPPAPTTINGKSPPVKMKSKKKNAVDGGKKESIGDGAATEAEEDRSKLVISGKFKSDKAAIRALPRELSIYNTDDDDITKYSVDDGQPTYEVEKSEFRDAYNVRGIFTGTIHRSSGMPHGFGKMVYHLGGRYYEGDWHMGHWHGKGVFRNQDGDVYEGHMVNDLKEGTGKLQYADGRVFQGRFDDDEAVEGTIKFPDGAKYEGELHNGARHGFGVYYFNDGSVYEGDSVMNVFEGKGKMTWNDGGWYEGGWSQGEIHGEGKEIRPDGSLRHDGRWSKGVPIRD
ncbi:MAG: hypothetical protein SGILL_006822 [Bacillariaceae sp.]